MSYYRDVYLKSDDWKSLRAAKIHKQKAKCQLCGRKSLSNDVHHLKYRRLWNVRMGDLRVVCRGCHDFIHDLLKKYPKMKKMPPLRLWKQTKMHWNRAARYSNAAAQLKSEQTWQLRFGRACELFGEAKRSLAALGLVFKSRMVGHEWVLKHENMRKALLGGDHFAVLQEYIRLTHRDPRRLIPVLYRRGL